jgi:hypothetical protein
MKNNIWLFFVTTPDAYVIINSFKDIEIGVSSSSEK